MRTNKMFVVVLLVSFVTIGVSGIPMPSTDSMVIVPESTTVAETTAVDTVKPRITAMHVESNVTSRYANTLITSRVINPGAKSNEVTFSVILPETAFISGFSMEIDGKVYDAYVKEKEEAKKVYESAVSSGQAAAHIALKARDSNHFTVSVNIEPRSKAIFRLKYEELLQKRLGLYNLIINLNPGQIVDDLSVDVNIKENSPISFLLVPELRTGNEIDPLPTDPSDSHSIKTISEDKLQAKVHFSPDKTQQLELMQIFKDKQMRTTTQSPYPFDPFIPKENEKVADGISGQFVVQYDVEIDAGGEILVNDGYFVHFFAPKNLKPLRKHVIFVLDVSGSMIGKKIMQLREAMISILESLNPGDYFNIIDFSYSARVYNLDDGKHVVYKTNKYNYFYGDQEETTVSLDTIPPKPKLATPENINKAKEIIKQLTADGGTNIYDALTIAFKIANYGIEAQKSDSTTPSTKKYRQEPMIIFLTDGDPTVGETNTETIIKTVKELNSKNTALFSLAFGEDADRNFLRKLSLQNLGFMRHIYEASDAVLQLQHFYKQISSPLLSGITYTYPENQIDENTITKKKFDHYFLGSELIVAGKLKDNTALDTSVKVSCHSLDGPIDFIPIVVNITKREFFWPLERLWAYLSIKQLLDEKDISDNNSTKDSTKKALDIALKYSFVTPLTSLVVVKPNDTLPVDAEAVPTKPHMAFPLAAYASPLAGGFPVLQAPFRIAQPQPMSASAMHSYSAARIAPFPSYKHSTFMHRRIQDRFSFQEADSDFGLEEDSLDSVPVSSSGSFGHPGLPGASGASYASYPSHLPPPLPPRTPYPPAPSTTSRAPPPPYRPDYRPDIPSISNEDLAVYGLETYTWLEKYLLRNENSINIPLTNGTSLNLKLIPLSERNNTVIEPKHCPESIDGGEGICEYLTHCDELSKGFKDLTTYTNYVCDADGYAGICCKTKSSNITTQPS